jgi:hypothetical protein
MVGDGAGPAGKGMRIVRVRITGMGGSAGRAGLAAARGSATQRAADAGEIDVPPGDEVRRAGRGEADPAALHELLLLRRHGEPPPFFRLKPDRNLSY